MDMKSEDESFKSNERQKSEHTHRKLLIWPKRLLSKER
jgi:hypothetical protein